jgi:hypothetical protein
VIKFNSNIACLSQTHPLPRAVLTSSKCNPGAKLKTYLQNFRD